MSVQVSYKKQIVFTIILALIVLLVIEGILSIYLFSYGPCKLIASGIFKNMDRFSVNQRCNDYRDIALLNGMDEHYIPNQHSKTVNIDNYGFRGPDITKNKPPNTYRIFFIGGSTAYGWGSTSDSTTIPAYLQKHFEDLGLPYKVQVINAAVEGASSIEETYWIKNKLISFQPDMFIVYDGLNEMGTPYERLSDPTKLATTPQKQVLTFLQITIPWYKTPVMIPTFLNILSHRFENESTIYFHFPDDGLVINRSSLWHQREKEICELGNKEGFKTVILLQPFLGTGNKTMTSYEYDYYVHENGKKTIANYDVFAKGLDGLENYCTKTADLRNIFDGNSELLYFDYGHIVDTGNKIVADSIFKSVSPIVLDDISKQTTGNYTKK